MFFRTPDTHYIINPDGSSQENPETDQDGKCHNALTLPEV